jgi:CelD/BcsL family acetyltransferase involved in cellulose biosynthesis
LLQIKEINDVDRFFELKHDWNQLLEKSDDNNVFLTWEFLFTCWGHFGSNKKLKILTVEDDGKIVAIAPLRLSRYNLKNLFRYNVIEPLGYMTADYTGILLGEHQVESLCLMLKYLAKNVEWNFIYLYDLAGVSKIPELLSQTSGVPKFELVQGKTCPYISALDSKDTFLDSLDSSFKKDMRRSMRNLETNHGKVEIERCDKPSTVDACLPIFFDLHQNRWVSKSEGGVFRKKETRDFYSDISRKWAENGWLALYFLKVNDKPVAAQYCVEYQNKMCYVLGGFDVEYSKYSIGNLLTFKIIEDCIQRGLHEFDFLKGDEAYKFRWTEQYRRNVGVRFVNNNFTSKLYWKCFNLLKRTRIYRLMEQ